jgi:hypothetical protein
VNLNALLMSQVRPGQTSDPTSGFATATGYQSSAGAASVAPTPSLTPMLGGGRTPLVGDAKVTPESPAVLDRPAIRYH